MNLKKKFVMVLACLLLAFSCMGLVACGHPEFCTVTFVYSTGTNGVSTTTTVQWHYLIAETNRPTDPEPGDEERIHDSKVYRFAGWGTGKSFLAENLDEANLIDFDTWEVMRDTTLYAKYVKYGIIVST